MLKDIEDFHKKFELPQAQNPSLLSPELYQFRIRFMQEELDEFILSHQQNDLAGCLDALIDLTYVVLGTAWLMNVPFKEGWQLVHEANMKKVRAEAAIQSKRQTLYDVVKPLGWQAPDLTKILP